MVMVGQLIHGDQRRLGLHPAHVIEHGTEEALTIPIKRSIVAVAVLFHPCQEPGKRLHKCIIIHDGIPLVALQPLPRVTIMLR